MKKIIFQFFLIIIFCMYSCGKRETIINDNKNLTPSYKLNIKNTVSFPLDSVTPPESYSIQYFEINKSKYLSFVNQHRNTIYIYDYLSKKMLKNIILNTEGSNGIGKISGHRIINFDSICVYTYGKKRIYLVNGVGRVLNKYSLTDTENVKYIPSPKAWTNVPMIIRNNNIFLGGAIAGEYIDENRRNRPVMSSINLKDNKVNYFYPYPKLYSKGNWGGALFRWIYYDYIEKENSFIFSFPADHNIYVTSDFTNENKYYAGSKYFNDIYSLNSNKITYSKKRRRKHFATTPSYSEIKYDKYNDVYYRFSDQPVKDYVFRKNDVKQTSIIILDKDFKWIGEEMIPMYSHSSAETFINEKGLHIKKYTKDENSITFSIFNLDKLSYE